MISIGPRSLEAGAPLEVSSSLPKLPLPLLLFIPRSDVHDLEARDDEGRSSSWFAVGDGALEVANPERFAAVVFVLEVGDAGLAVEDMI